jgi:hypothetical protein
VGIEQKLADSKFSRSGLIVLNFLCYTSAKETSGSENQLLNNKNNFNLLYFDA